MHRSEHIRLFCGEIWVWYAVHKRVLPWRDLAVADDDARAYRVLVSEIMLQQTQVRRVVHTYQAFLQSFPTLADLAAADTPAVLRAWRGMGYNSRALRLRDAARMIHLEHGGVFPRTMQTLRSVPGIGPYTAAAVRNFAWNIPTACLDTNIRRILHRTFYGPEQPDGHWRVSDATLLSLAEKILQQALRPDASVVQRLAHADMAPAAAEWHAALMDFGSLVQTKNTPDWEHCPLTQKQLMKTTRRQFERRKAQRLPQAAVPREPGRMVGTRFVPNRIFRGRIVDALRDTSDGYTCDALGRMVCLDWSAAEHRAWLESLLADLCKDHLLSRKGTRYVLGG